MHKFEPFTFKECSHQDKDPAMTKNVTGRRKCCLEVMSHDSPAVSPSNSDHKGASNEFGSIAGVRERNKSKWTIVEALMGMGKRQMKYDDSMSADDEVEIDDDSQEDIV